MRTTVTRFRGLITPTANYTERPFWDAVRGFPKAGDAAGSDLSGAALRIKPSFDGNGVPGLRTAWSHLQPQASLAAGPLACIS
jgi:hypothetical protein